ncbi:DUF7577 domain-containing protein [Natronolimnohabitans innermongolicus]|uniref:DUF7577 domain-containing protein n=1 Tax=Natronolimnohabitans innermongolicus JCM 12255 TaxID=1227499 RepID=L9WLT6_9EURY|nr:hypothetical protein [Natronolimnohabitans innermongolicus]ELY49313.1 hypothetical protein C493_20621 [Natronolimnohabitans innermongolicus JCM 12255]
MDPVTVALGTLILFVAPLLLLFVIAYRLTGSTENGTENGAGVDRERTIARDPETIRCSGCGAENELGYTYCAHCLEALPSSGSLASSSDSAGSRDPF